MSSHTHARFALLHIKITEWVALAICISKTGDDTHIGRMHCRGISFSSTLTKKPAVASMHTHTIRFHSISIARDKKSFVNERCSFCWGEGGEARRRKPISEKLLRLERCVCMCVLLLLSHLGRCVYFVAKYIQSRLFVVTHHCRAWLLRRKESKRSFGANYKRRRLWEIIDACC